MQYVDIFCKAFGLMEFLKSITWSGELVLRLGHSAVQGIACDFRCSPSSCDSPLQFDRWKERFIYFPDQSWFLRRCFRESFVVVFSLLPGVICFGFIHTRERKEEKERNKEKRLFICSGVGKWVGCWSTDWSFWIYFLFIENTLWVWECFALFAFLGLAWLDQEEVNQ